MTEIPPPPAYPHRLLNMASAAKYLRIHPRTVRKYVQSGAIKARLIGRRWRFRLSDLDEFFESLPSSWPPGSDDNSSRQVGQEAGNGKSEPDPQNSGGE